MSEPTFYLLADIGCIECGEPSDFALYATETEAIEAAEAAREKQQATWTGQHTFAVIPLEAPQLGTRIGHSDPDIASSTHGER